MCNTQKSWQNKKQTLSQVAQGFILQLLFQDHQGTGSFYSRKSWRCLECQKVWTQTVWANTVSSHWIKTEDDLENRLFLEWTVTLWRQRHWPCSESHTNKLITRTDVRLSMECVSTVKYVILCTPEVAGCILDQPDILCICIMSILYIHKLPKMQRGGIGGTGRC